MLAVMCSTARCTGLGSFLLRSISVVVVAFAALLRMDAATAADPPGTTTYGYDNNGNRTSIQAPLGRNTTQVFDEHNRLVRITDPTLGVTSFAYDAADNLISVTDPRGKITSYTYNGFGNLTQQISPDTGTTNFTYDEAGNLKTRTDARNTTATYTYDALNRTTQAAYGDQTISFTYDTGPYGIGHLTGASDSSHSLSWRYDPHGRVIGKTQVVGTISKSVSYAYTNGLLTSLTTPSGQVVAYTYANHQITGIAINGVPLISNAQYEPFGPPKQWTWGNSTLSARTLDLDGKVTQIDSAGSKTYAYDDASRITGITDPANSEQSWFYSYDPLDRLTSASKSGTTLGWSYDANGNRLTQSGTSTQTLTYPATSDRLSSITGTPARTYSYDPVGNVIGDGTRTFAYNNRGRMKSTTSGGTTVTYVHNAIGQLIKKSNGALFFYDEAGQLLGQYSLAGALVQETIWLDDIPVATLRPNTGGGIDIFYIHTDHLNTPRKITQPSDNRSRWRWDPTPFGMGAANENPEGLGAFAFLLRFPGQIYLSETGLHYNYYRDCYDPATGRYCQSDPIGLDGGLNTYAYAEGNPISLVDPEGLQAIPWWLPRPVVAPRPEVVPRPIPFPADPAFPLPIPSERDDKLRQQCEQQCDAQWDRDVFECEWKWKMKGRQKGEFNACYTEARKRHLSCIQACSQVC